MGFSALVLFTAYIWCIYFEYVAYFAKHSYVRWFFFWRNIIFKWNWYLIIDSFLVSMYVNILIFYSLVCFVNILLTIILPQVSDFFLILITFPFLFFVNITWFYYTLIICIIIFPLPSFFCLLACLILYLIDEYSILSYFWNEKVTSSSVLHVWSLLFLVSRLSLIA